MIRILFLLILLFSCTKKEIKNDVIVHIDNYYMPRCEKNLQVMYNLSYSINGIKDTINVYNYNASDSMLIKYKGDYHIYVTKTKIYDLYTINDYLVNRNDSIWFINIINK